jgi:hypothetical protein
VPVFKLPLSGDVVQSINPFTAFMTGGQFGLININLGQSSDPAVEADVLSDVATYGKQLGRIGDALAVLLAHVHPRRPLNAQETTAIDALKEMLDKIADVRERHQRAAIRPDAVSSAPWPLVHRTGPWRRAARQDNRLPRRARGAGPRHLRRIR